MIVAVWVYFVLGDSLNQYEHRTAYVQQTASQTEHRKHPDRVEHDCEEEFHRLYPSCVVTDSGWKTTYVKVMGE